MRKENKSHTDKLCVIRLISTIGILGCVVNTKVNTNECVDITYSFSLHVGIQLKQPSWHSFYCFRFSIATIHRWDPVLSAKRLNNWHFAHLHFNSQLLKQQIVKLSEVQKCESPLENFHMVSTFVLYVSILCFDCIIYFEMDYA